MTMTTIYLVAFAPLTAESATIAGVDFYRMAFDAVQALEECLSSDPTHACAMFAVEIPDHWSNEQIIGRLTDMENPLDLLSDYKL
jgi:hypothetical protein